MSRKKRQISDLDLSKIGDRIAYLRLSRGMTQDQFSQLTGFSKGNVNGLESHKYDPSYRAITRLIELFEVDSNWLLFGDSPKRINEDKELLPYKQSVISEHQDIVKKFKNPERAKNINIRLLEIEELSEKIYDRVDIYIEAARDSARAEKGSKRTRKIGQDPRTVIKGSRSNRYPEPNMDNLDRAINQGKIKGRDGGMEERKTGTNDE